MPELAPPSSLPVNAVLIGHAHQLYCQLTGQSLRLGFDRERMWYELLRLGYSLQDLRALIAYLQREIRAQRRNVGALKLSNLLQPDRFEEDLNISHIRLTPKPPRPTAAIPLPPSCSPDEQERGRQHALAQLRNLKDKLRQNQT
jgi:hypothetical protein